MTSITREQLCEQIDRGEVIEVDGRLVDIVARTEDMPAAELAQAFASYADESEGEGVPMSLADFALYLDEWEHEDQVAAEIAAEEERIASDPDIPFGY